MKPVHFILAADAARDAGKKEFEFPKGSGKMHPVTIKKDVKVDELFGNSIFDDDEDEEFMGVKVKENKFLAASMEDLEQVIRNLAHTGDKDV